MWGLRDVLSSRGAAVVRKPLAFLSLVAASMVALFAHAVGASTGLVWPADPLVVVKSDAGLTANVPVLNTTDLSFSVASAPAGNAPADNACAVQVISGGTIAGHRAGTIGLLIAPREPGCKSPTDGNQSIVLNASAEQGAQVDSVRLPIRKDEVPDEEPKATGLIWPDKAVFLQRRDGGLIGSFTVTNPTPSAIDVLPPTFGEGCRQSGFGEPISVEARRPETIQITGPASCDDLSSREVAATALATSAGGVKSDVGNLTLQAEVDWGRFGLLLLGSVAICALGAVGSAASAMLRHKIGPNDPLLIDDSAPTSWLSGIAAIGSLLTTLVSTTGLAKGLFGTDAIPQTTLILGVGAIGLALVGLSGVVTGLPVKARTVEGKRQASPAVWQFTVGAGVSASAAAIQLWAVHRALSRLDLPIQSSVLNGVAIAAAVLLVVYLVYSVEFYIREYGRPAEATKTPSPELVAALTSALTPHYGGGAGRPQSQALWREAAESAARDAQRIANDIIAAPALAAPGDSESTGLVTASVDSSTRPRFTRPLI